MTEVLDSGTLALTSGPVYDPSGKLATQYDVPGMPSSFVVGPDGAVAARHIGFRDSSRADREAELQRLLSGPGVVPTR